VSVKVTIGTLAAKVSIDLFSLLDIRHVTAEPARRSSAGVGGGAVLGHHGAGARRPLKFWDQ
jgi:hypothetical protein